MKKKDQRICEILVGKDSVDKVQYRIWHGYKFQDSYSHYRQKRARPEEN